MNKDGDKLWDYTERSFTSRYLKSIQTETSNFIVIGEKGEPGDRSIFASKFDIYGDLIWTTFILKFRSSYFKQHWFNIGILNSKFDIIMTYEVNWSTRLKRLGFIGTSLYGDSTTANNPTHVDWKNLIKNNYPYLKKELIRDNPLRIDLSELPTILSSYEKDWQAWILEYIERYSKNKSHIAESLQSNKSTQEQSTVNQ